ncbi:MAG: tetratricopeptide repeat protein [Bacteroidaceae bacterium]
MTNNNKQALDINEQLSKSEAFIVKNKNAVIGGVIAIVVLVGGYFLYHNFVALPQAEKASTMLAKGDNYFRSNDYEKALNGDGAGFIGYIKIANEYSSTDAANIANLQAGLCYAQMGKTKEAIKYLEEFNPAGDAIISPAAIGALGNCYAKDGQLEKAVSTLKEAAKMTDNNSLSPIYLIQAGEILESQNKKDDAKVLYEEIRDKYFQSMQAQDIDKYIERVTK